MLTNMKVGARVRSKIEFAGVPKGTEGVVIKDYGSGIIIAWDAERAPYPKGKTPQQVANMAAVDPRCPFRDGFDKATELKLLENINEEDHELNQ